MFRAKPAQRLLCCIFALLPLSALVACKDGGVADSARGTPAPQASASASPMVVWNEQLPAAVTPAPSSTGNAPLTPIPTVYSLTTGRLLPSGVQRPPVLAVIGNAPRTRPQTGLMQADILYEFVLDRGDTTTRLVALYSDEYPTLAGPITSARIYFFDLQREYGCMMVYDGYPDEPNYPRFNESTIDIPAAYSNELRYLFTRDTTVSSLQENTLFCRIDELAGALYGAGGPALLPRFTFDRDAAWDGAKRFTRVGLSFSGKDTGKAEFVYDGRDNLLYRYERNSKGTLAESRTLTADRNGALQSEPVCVQNLIVQYIPYAPLSDTYYMTELLGSGRCDYFINGLHTPGYWRRETLDGVTSYYLRDGSPLVLVPGTTWIALHSDQRQIKIQHA